MRMLKRYWELMKDNIRRHLYIIIIVLGFIGVISGCSRLEERYNEVKDIPSVKEVVTRIYWQDRLQWNEYRDCSEESGFGQEDAGIEVHALNDNESLVLVVCNVYAYQADYLAFYYNHTTGDATPLEVVRYQGTDGGPSPYKDYDLGGFAWYEDGTLLTYTKYAGHGTCGERASYAWNDATKEFDLMRFEAEYDCVESDQLDDWPVIYDIL